VTPALAATLLGLGAAGGFLAGLLGVGGALVLIPLLLYVPPWLGVGVLDVRAVAAVSMVQVFVAALSGVLAHRRHRAVHGELAWVGGLTMAAASFLGASLSRVVPERWILLVFALMATGAAVLLAVPEGAWGSSPAPSPGAPDGPLVYSRLRAGVVAGVVGLAAGLVGAGGAFLLVPLLITVVGIPVRVTIGSSLAITAVGATAGFLGKLVSGQIPPGPALAVALGAVPGAQLGAAVSRRLASSRLRAALFAVVVFTAVRVWWDVLSR
jgi:hypothetical protein